MNRNEYARQWRKDNPKKSNAATRRYRQKNLEECRRRGRECQVKLNNKNRFGGLKFKVLERDRYICQICKKDVSGKGLAVVHHKDGDKQNNTMKNLVTLCKSCHPKIHYSLHSYQFTSDYLKKIWKEQGSRGFNRE